MNILQTYGWPGNVRELEHEIERAITLANEGQKIIPQLLSEDILRSTTSAFKIHSKDQKLQDLVAQFEKSVIQEKLQQCNSNVTKAANELGITRQGLFKKMVKYNINRSEYISN